MLGSAACSFDAALTGPLNAKLARLGTTIFAETPALSVDTGAINLVHGFPGTRTSAARRRP